MSIPIDYTISTPRLLLKSVAEEDLPFVFDATRYAGFNDGMLWEPPATVEELRPHLQSSADAWINEGNFSFSIWSVDVPAQFIGRISIRKTEIDNVYNIGYWTHPRKQGNGFMTEAVEAILAFGFNKLDALEIVAEYATWNEASGRVLEKVGMNRIAYIAEGFRKKGVWVPEYRMSINRSQWAQRC